MSHTVSPIQSWAGRLAPLRVFLLVWVGQLISTTGTGLSDFALGLWVFRQAGSVTQFAFFFLFRTVPAVVVSPLAGVLADRWNRRTLMLLSDAGSALVTLGIAGLVLTGRLEVRYVYGAAALNAIFSAFQQPAYLAATGQLVPHEHLGRAGGLLQVGQAVADILSPLLAGVLLVVIGLGGILVIDFVTFLAAVLTLVVVRFPGLPVQVEQRASLPPIWKSAVQGWEYIAARRGLVALLLYSSLFTFLVDMAGPLIPPLVLSFAAEQGLGLMLSIAGVGLLLGGLALGTWGGPRRRVAGMLGSALLLGTGLAVMGLQPSLPLVAIGAFCAHFTFPFVNGLGQAIWLQKVETCMQGRTFAIRQLVSRLASPVAVLSAGLLADRVFGPWLTPGGALAGGLGTWWGTGTGRGIALLFAAVGLLTVGLSLLAVAYSPLRQLETSLPDAVQPPETVD